MDNTQDNLIALVGSRICHDLISPIGAISNGVELMSMAGGNGEQELALISESVDNANARIRFFRIAFGHGSRDQQVGAREMSTILSDMTRGGRLSFQWALTDPVPRAEARLAFLVLLCLESSMPIGGEVTVNHHEGNWHVIASARKMRLVEEHWDVLINPSLPHDITSAIVHFALAPDAARRCERVLQVDLAETRIEVRF